MSILFRFGSHFHKYNLLYCKRVGRQSIRHPLNSDLSKANEDMKKVTDYDIFIYKGERNISWRWYANIIEACCLEMVMLLCCWHPSVAHIALTCLSACLSVHPASLYFIHLICCGSIWVCFPRTGILPVLWHFKKSCWTAVAKLDLLSHFSQLFWAEDALFSALPHHQICTNSLHCTALYWTSKWLSGDLMLMNFCVFTLV